MNNQPYDMFAAACSSREAITRIANKWTMLLLMALAEKPYNFGELRRKVECISQKMLTQTLRQLEADGFVRRQVGSGRVVTVTYSLTSLGTSLIGPLASLQQWAIAHGKAFEIPHTAEAPQRAV